MLVFFNKTWLVLTLTACIKDIKNWTGTELTNINI